MQAKGTDLRLESGPQRAALSEAPKGSWHVAVGDSPPISRPNNQSAARAAQATGDTVVAGTYTNLLYHFVFSTKNRIPLISENVQQDLYSYIGGIVRGEGGTLLEIGGISDHVHLLAKLKPTKSISEILNRIKSKSSKWMNEEKMKTRKFGWQDGYGAFSVSESQIASVRRYIRSQEQHHQRQSFQDEFRALLEKQGIEYEERYLWD
jgi:REP element-mobilizing transposase RayT